MVGACHAVLQPHFGLKVWLGRGRVRLVPCRQLQIERHRAFDPMADLIPGRVEEEEEDAVAATWARGPLRLDWILGAIARV